MPFPMKIQPVDPSSGSKGSNRSDSVKTFGKSRLKRFFDRRQLPKLGYSSGEQQHCSKEGGSSGEIEPSSVCLAKMVQNFIEESNDKPAKCGRNRCNCFNGNDTSDDEFDFSGSGAGGCEGPMDACDILKSLVLCCSISERNLLADTAKIVEKNKICKRKDDCRKIVTKGLQSLGYNASICKSRWETSPSFPAGDYEYVDVIVEEERLLIDIDFKSEFEIARSTKNYRAVLQSLPAIFVGKPDRLQQIVAVISEAAKQSLKKKGLHFPPWRKPEYMRAKWLSPYQRMETAQESDCDTSSVPCLIKTRNFSGEFELTFGEKSSPTPTGKKEFGEFVSVTAENSGAEEKITVVVSPWQPPAVKPRAFGTKIVTGLASVLREKP